MIGASRRHRYAYIWQAIVATVLVLGAPAAYLGLVAPWAGMSPFSFTALAAALLVTVVTASLGSIVWSRCTHDDEIPFGELMLWTWARRHHAEEVVGRSVDRLGLDRAGRRVRSVQISSEDQLRMLRQLSDGLETKDPYTRHHSSRVERHAFKTALALGLPADEVEVLRRAASVHDVGKIHVSDAILRKPGTLTAHERSAIEVHPAIGARMVGGLGDDRIVQAVRHHHERWDGRGYPDGLSGDAIPLFARIIAVADTYDAITSTRAYRPSASSMRAQQIIREEAGAQFDPVVAEAFLSTVGDRSSILGGFLVLLAPDRVLARAGGATRRLAGASLAPALASVMALTVLGPASAPPEPAEAQAAPPAPVALPPGVPVVKGKVVNLGPDRDMTAKIRDVARTAPARSSRPARTLARAAAPTKAAKPAKAPVVTGKPAPKPPKPSTPPPAPEKHTPTTDPQPEKGQDCTRPPQSKGNDKHCGTG